MPASRLTIIQALIIRDLLVRHGRSNLGFFWDVMEPIVLSAGVMFIWSLSRDGALHGVKVTTFVITCYLPLTLSRHLIGPLSRLFRNNSSILFHRPVHHSYILVARISSEFLSSTTALVLVYSVTVALGIVDPVENYPLALAGWLFTGWFYGGVAVLACVATEVWEPAEKFVAPLQYLALPLSATFFLVDWLPPSVQQIILLNPAVHCYEIFRAGFFGPAVRTHYDMWYLTAWSASLTVLGAAAVYRVRDRIQVS